MIKRLYRIGENRTIVPNKVYPRKEGKGEKDGLVWDVQDFIDDMYKGGITLKE